MPNPVDAPPPPARGRRFAYASVGGASALAIAAALGVAWMERGRVASHLAQSYLAERGVSAAITFDEVGPSRLAGRAVLGPANDPDASVERFEVRLGGGGLGAPRVLAVRLIRPTLRVRFDGRRLDFGRLQRLVDELGRGPGGGPAPDLGIEGGVVRLVTPGGETRIGLDATTRAGRLMSARGAVSGGEIGFGELHARLGRGRADVARDGRGALSARFDLAAPELTDAGAQAQGLRASGTLALAPSTADRLAGPLQGEAAVEAASLAAGETRARRSRFSLNVDGELLGEGRRFRGGARLRLDASDPRTKGGSAGALQVSGVLSNLVLAPSRDAVEVSGHAALSGAVSGVVAGGTRSPMLRAAADIAALAGRVGRDGGVLALSPKLTLAAARLQAGAGDLIGADGAVDAGRASLSWDKGGLRFAAPLKIDARAERAVGAGTGLRAEAIRTGMAGQAALTAAGASLALAGSAAGDLSASAEAARRLAHAVPILGDDPAFEAAAVAAAKRVSVSAPQLAVSVGPRGWAWRAPAVQARAASGAVLALDAPTPHAASLTLAGGGLPEIRLEATRYDLGQGGALQAKGRVEAAWSGRSLDQARLRLAFAAARGGGALTVALTECGEVALGRFGEAASPLVTALSARACPSGKAPALAFDARGWRAQTRLEALAFRAPASEAAVTRGDVELALRGGRRGQPAGEATIAAARVGDTAAMRRFEPLAVTGRLGLAAGAWTGPLQLSEAAHGRALATVAVRHVMASSSGHADIAAPSLAFAKGGLQPKDITPVGADMASDVDGVVAFQGAVDWSPRGLTSSGRLTTTGLALTSPFGRVQGAAADIRLTSLAPLVSAPDQPVSAASIDWVLPLTAAKASVGLRTDAIAVGAASANVAGGAARLDPILLPYDHARGVAGVVRLENLDLAALVERFNLSDRLTIQARASGELPFSTQGGALRFAGGRLFATGPGRLSINPQALTSTTAAAAGPTAAGAPDMQAFALQALQDLAFDTLEAQVDSRPMGRLGVLFHIKGRHDPPKGGEVHVGLLDLLRGRALQEVKDLPKGTEVNLTLDTSLNFDELLAAYAGRDRSEPVQGPAAKP